MRGVFVAAHRVPQQKINWEVMWIGFYRYGTPSGVFGRKLQITDYRIGVEIFTTKAPRQGEKMREVQKQLVYNGRMGLNGEPRIQKLARVLPKNHWMVLPVSARIALSRSDAKRYPATAACFSAMSFASFKYSFGNVPAGSVLALLLSLPCK